MSFPLINSLLLSTVSNVTIIYDIHRKSIIFNVVTSPKSHSALYCKHTVTAALGLASVRRPDLSDLTFMIHLSVISQTNSKRTRHNKTTWTAGGFLGVQLSLLNEVN